jgi:photosystem II stability/assembly factor-like uncharacterized protein
MLEDIQAVKTRGSRPMKMIRGAGVALVLVVVALLSAQARAPAPSGIVVKAAKSVLFDLARFDGKLVAVGERGLVMESTDEGRSWSDTLTSTNRTLNSVLYVGDKIGIAAGHGGTLLRTEDDGTTWTAVKIDAIGRDSILGLTALSDGRILAYGAFGMYLESDDKGKSWTRKPVVKEGFERHISKIAEIGNGRLFLVGESGAMAISPDMGATWKELKSPYENEGSFFGIIRATDGGLLVFGMRGRVYRSTDEGVNWTRIPIPSTITFNAGSIAGDGRIVLVGNGGLIATSSDDGRSFALRYVKEGQPLGQALFTKDGSIAYVGSLSTGRLDAPAQNGPASEEAR